MDKELYEKLHKAYIILKDNIKTDREDLEQFKQDLEDIKLGKKTSPMLSNSVGKKLADEILKEKVDNNQIKIDQTNEQQVSELLAEWSVNNCESVLEDNERKLTTFVSGVDKSLDDETDRTYLYYNISKDRVYKYRHLLSRKYVFFDLDDPAHEEFIDNNNIVFFTQSIKNPDIRTQDFEEIRENYILYLLNAPTYEDTYSFDSLKTTLYSGSIRVRKAQNNSDIK
ncbi:MAG: hypothetical protein E7159_00050 [Firmicutes bacterium]|nr:hypothetical protein [Bacillota bacterium]